MEKNISIYTWINKSIISVLNHYDSTKKTFVRTSEARPSAFYPTATFHSLNALCLYIKLSNVLDNKMSGTNSKILKKIVIDVLSNLFNTNEDHFIDLLSKSSHYTKDTNAPRNLVVISNLIEALNNCFEVLNKDEKEVNLDVIKKSLEVVYHIVLDVINNRGSEIYVDVGESPVNLINFVNSIVGLKKLQKFGLIDKNINFEEILLKGNTALLNHINYYVSRHSNTRKTALFDPVSLTSCLYTASRTDNRILDSNFIQYCFKIISDTQYEDGCWPNGVSLTFSDTADVVQQPSVGVALNLVSTVIRPEYLIDKSNSIESTISCILPCLRRYQQFCESTFEEYKSFSGWSSDRIRRTNYTECWITAQVATFLMNLFVVEESLKRQIGLDKLGVGTFLAKPDGSADLMERIQEPDHVHTPINKIHSRYIYPILKEKEQNKVFNIPENVSFILFGPPGSGKTYLVNQLAKALNWPLVELSPGHFIKNGLELIESTAKEIFEKLEDIFHTVVFFDECDELFRSRKESEKTRSILSFATASMLPKIQRLHDNKNVIFILGTNYIHNMDDAVLRAGRFDDHFLIDRPDAIARKFILSKIYSLQDEILEKAVENSKGITVPELLKYDISVSPIYEREEYKNWCDQVGVNEINTARISQAERILILERWKLL